MGERLVTDVFDFAGVALRITRRDIHASDDDDDDEFVDPYFFDEGYSVAATTGFCRVWEAAEVRANAGRGGRGTDVIWYRLTWRDGARWLPHHLPLRRRNTRQTNEMKPAERQGKKKVYEHS